MYERLGEVLETICRMGSREAVLVAPFIKRGALGRLLAKLPDGVRLLCVTRWRPEEIAAGVSDPDIWLDLQQRAGATLRLCPSLHAKYYRVDEACLLGSANLTDTALGWSATPNFEILYPLPDGAVVGQDFERQLMALSIPCQEVIYQEMKATAALLKAEMPPFALLTDEAIGQHLAETHGLYETIPAAYTMPQDLSRWLPQSRQPADLFSAYAEQWENLITAAHSTTLVDLAALQIPPNLTESLFVRYVALQLLQIPCIALVDEFVSRSQRFGAVRDYLKSLPCSSEPSFDATNAWQTLMRWLLYFLPERYERTIPRHSEIFQRRK